MTATLASFHPGDEIKPVRGAVATGRRSTEAGVRTSIWLVVGVSVAAGGGCARGEAEEVVARSLVLQAADVVEVAEGEVLEGVSISGPLDPYRSVEVRAQLAGELEWVGVDRGVSVSRGDVLARYDAATFHTQLLGSRAAVAAGEAAVAAASQRLESAGVLHAAGAISDQDLREAKSGAKAAAAQLAAARAQAAQAEEAANRATVRAAIGGIVSARLVSEGEAVRPGQPLFRIVDVDTLELAARVPAGALGTFERGDRVIFEIGGSAGRRLSGYVDRIEPVADAATRQVGIYARLPNLDGRLVGGLYASGQIVTREVRGAVLPAGSLANGADGVVHVLAVEDGRLVRRQVRVLARDAAEDVVVVDGVDPGARIVARPGADLEPGTLVEMVGEARVGGEVAS